MVLDISILLQGRCVDQGVTAMFAIVTLSMAVDEDWERYISPIIHHFHHLKPHSTNPRRFRYNTLLFLSKGGNLIH